MNSKLRISKQQIAIIRTLSFLALVLGACNPQISKYIPSKTDIRTTADSSFKQHIAHISCTNPLNYVPDTVHPDYYPTRYVKVNFHFVTNSKGTANFDEEYARQYAHDILQSANQRLQSNKKMHLPIGNSTAVYPINIQYILSPDSNIPGDDGIYYHIDNRHCYFNPKDKENTIYSSWLYTHYGVQKGKVINVFFIERGPDSLDNPINGKMGGIGMGPWAKVAGVFSKSTEVFYNDGTKDITYGAWFMSKLLNHELGHCLGLSHTWNQRDGCDDTPQNPNCWSKGEAGTCDTLWSNNVMDYNIYRDALTPCQIGRMHYRFTLNNTVQRNVLSEDWCKKDTSQTIIIRRGEHIEWPCNRDIHGDIIIEPKATLILHCLVSMPAGSKIIVQPGANLVLDACELSNRCGDEWQGIEVWERNELSGQVYVLNHSIIRQFKIPFGESRLYLK